MSERGRPSAEPGARASTGQAWMWGLLAMALALRAWNAAGSSLWLDDFHSLHHASAPTLTAFFRGLLQDNHPPLSFLLVRAARALFGQDEWVLRLPALLAGLGAVGLTWRLARHAELRARVLATALVAVSSLHIELSTDVRMYALLALCSAGLLDALLDLLGEGRGRGRLALWTALGLHAHYHFLYPLVLLVPAAFLLAPRARRPIAQGALAGLLLALPWYALGFPRQLAHGLAPGGSSSGFERLAEGLFHLEFLNVSVAGSALRALFLIAGGLFWLLVAAGLVAGVRGGPEARARTAMLGLGGLGVPVLATLSAVLSARAGFEWRYLAGAVVPVALLTLGRTPVSRPRLGGLAVVVACAALLSGLNARDAGEEDYRGAIAELFENVRPGDRVVAADRQPLLFPHSMAWDYYAPRLARGRPIPATLDFDDTFTLTDPEVLASTPRVWCVLRSMNDGCALLGQLRRHYGVEVKKRFGRAIWLHRFEQP